MSEINTINKWIEQYRPQVISDLIGNDEERDVLTKWLKEYDISRKSHFLESQIKKKKGKRKVEESEEKDIKVDTPINVTDALDDELEDIVIPISKIKKKGERLLYSSALILGNHGIGKISIVKVILKELNYEIDVINMYNLTSHKNIDEKINKLTKGINIFDSFNGKQSAKKAIVIDEIETISTQIEKKFIENLFKLNEEKWFFPIIFISSNKHSKLINTLKINALTIQLKQPTFEDMKCLFIKIIKKEGLTFDKETTMINIINHAQRDFRRLTYLLFDIYTSYKKKRITEIMFDEYCDTSKIKDTDVDIFKSTANLILRYKNMDECLRLYYAEKVIIPLMIQQNYPNCLLKYNSKIDDTLEFAKNISERLALGDIVENYIYSDQNWDMSDVHCFYSCIYPAYRLTNGEIDVSPEAIRLEFTHDLNRTSIRKINKKNVVNAKEFLTNMDINDLMMACELTQHCLNDNDERTDQCVEKYNSYSAGPATITSVLKSNKLSGDKNKCPSNSYIKKLFKNTNPSTTDK